VDDTYLKDLARQVGELANTTGLRVGVAESLTGGLVSSALAAAPGAGAWYRGCVVAHSRQVKHDLLDVPPGPVVSPRAAEAMAGAARRLLGAHLAVSITGSGGPAPQDGQPPGTVFIGVADDHVVEIVDRRYPADDPEQICHTAAADALGLLARRITELASLNQPTARH